MVIGKGLIGNRLKELDRDDFVIFAAGVSNSKSASIEDYQREIVLVKETMTEYKNRLFIYFSTYSIDDPSLQDSPYVLHKKEMEALIQHESTSYLIIRTSNLVGKNLYNPNTVLNYFYSKIKNNDRFDCWISAERNLLDIDHLFEMLKLVLLKYKYINHTIYLVNPYAFKVLEIVNKFAELLRRTAYFNPIDRGVSFTYNTDLSAQLFKQLGIDSTGYLETLIQKYYIHEN